MPAYEAGDHVKVDFSDESGRDGEWMWVIVDGCDEENRLVFGRLDSIPILHADRLSVGQEMAVSFDRIREHMKPRKNS